MGAVVMVGVGLGASAAWAQPGAVMQIPVPAPQSGSAAIGSGPRRPASPRTSVLGGAEVLAGEPLAIPGETVPVGRWAGRAGVKEIALAEMPWMGGAGYGLRPGATVVVAKAQYRVVVATPNQVHADALKQVVPEAIALEGQNIMQAGAFSDWRRANALRRALGAYGFVVNIQGL